MKNCNSYLECIANEKHRKSLLSTNRKLRANLKEIEKYAEDWMNKYYELKEKHEPSIIIETVGKNGID